MIAWRRQELQVLTTIGNWNMIGGQVGIVGHINIGNQVKIQAQSGVNKNVKDGEALYGAPAIDAGDYQKKTMCISET